MTDEDDLNDGLDPIDGSYTPPGKEEELEALRREVKRLKDLVEEWVDYADNKARRPKEES